MQRDAAPPAGRSVKSDKDELAPNFPRVFKSQTPPKPVLVGQLGGNGRHEISLSESASTFPPSGILHGWLRWNPSRHMFRIFSQSFFPLPLCAHAFICDAFYGLN